MGYEGIVVSRQPSAVSEKRTTAFTLVEILIVTTLITVGLGMVMFKMDGLTDGSRLRSSAVQIGSLLKLTQTQARTSGQPRLVAYPVGEDRVLVRRPRSDHGIWSWDEGVEYITATGVHVWRVLTESDSSRDVGLGTGVDRARVLQRRRGVHSKHAVRGEHAVHNKHAVRVGADGRYRAHAVVLEIHDRYLVAVLTGLSEPRYVRLERPPQATTFELLLLELEHSSDAR